MHQMMNPEMQACIEACQKCHATCLSHLMHHCLPTGGAHLEPAHVAIMMDCIQICSTSADFMIRMSKHHPHICRECSEICTQCADSCAQLDGMEACVEACRDCAAKCGAMAA